MPTVQRSPVPVSDFDRLADQVRAKARALDRIGESLGADAWHQAQDGFQHVQDSAAFSLGSGVNLLATGTQLGVGLARSTHAGSHVAAAMGLLALGSGSSVLEWLSSAGRSAATNLARGLASIANSCRRVLGDTRVVTVRDIQVSPPDRGARLSKQLFVAAGQQVGQSSRAARAAWNAFEQAVAHAVGAGVNLAQVARHTAAVAGHLLSAALASGAAGLVKIAEYGVRVAGLGVEFAEKGVDGAGQLAVLGARISAALANFLALPDQAQIEVDGGAVVREFQTELGSSAQTRPALQQALVGAH